MEFLALYVDLPNTIVACFPQADAVFYSEKDCIFAVSVRIAKIVAPSFLIKENGSYLHAKRFTFVVTDKQYTAFIIDPMDDQQLASVFRYLFFYKPSLVRLVGSHQEVGAMLLVLSALNVRVRPQLLPTMLKFPESVLYAQLNKTLAHSFPGAKIPVFVNVYQLFRGAFHTSIELGEFELAFGKTECEICGIYAMRSQKNPQFEFLHSEFAGYFDGDAHQAIYVILRCSADWGGCSYHLVRHNCNDFTDDALYRLGIVYDVSKFNRLAMHFRRNPRRPLKSKLLFVE